MREIEKLEKKMRKLARKHAKAKGPLSQARILKSAEATDKRIKELKERK